MKAKQGEKYASLIAPVALFISSIPSFAIPSFSNSMLVLAFVASSLTVVVYQKLAFERAKHYGLALFNFMLFVGSYRILSESLFQDTWSASVILGLPYLLVIVLSFKFPKLSIWIYREMESPSTRFGRVIGIFSIVSIPTLIAISTGLGRGLAQAATRAEQAPPWEIVGILLYITALANGQLGVSRFLIDKNTGVLEKTTHQRKGRIPIKLNLKQLGEAKVEYRMIFMLTGAVSCAVSALWLYNMQTYANDPPSYLLVLFVFLVAAFLGGLLGLILVSGGGRRIARLGGLVLGLFTVWWGLQFSDFLSQIVQFALVSLFGERVAVFALFVALCIVFWLGYKTWHWGQRGLLTLIAGERARLTKSTASKKEIEEDA